ncbi:MAG: hypothetical protein IKT16_02600, partial [Desulfovibrio sp.]|nr:hypothetical protein [Desulfovibrio sp.]
MRIASAPKESIDFQMVNKAALANSSYMESLLPQAVKVGREYTCGDIFGNSGHSFSLNAETGVWSDFATGETGGDVVALVAAREDIKQGEAAMRIAEDLGIEL